MFHRGLSRPEPNGASSPTLHKDPPLKVQITHTHTHIYIYIYHIYIPLTSSKPAH